MWRQSFAVILRRGEDAAPQDEDLFCWTIPNPHGEERRTCDASRTMRPETIVETRRKTALLRRGRSEFAGAIEHHLAVQQSEIAAQIVFELAGIAGKDVVAEHGDIGGETGQQPAGVVFCELG